MRARARVVSDRETNIVLGLPSYHAHVAPSVWKDGRVDPRLLDPVCRLSVPATPGWAKFSASSGPQWKDVRGRRRRGRYAARSQTPVAAPNVVWQLLILQGYI
jgi:hypothetical protein